MNAALDAFWRDMQDEIRNDPEYAGLHLAEWRRVLMRRRARLYDGEEDE